LLAGKNSKLVPIRQDRSGRQTFSLNSFTTLSNGAQTVLAPKEGEHSEIAAWEANHRMMNILTRLLAMLRRDFSSFDDEQVRAAVAGFEVKIMALSELLRSVSPAPGANDIRVDSFFERLGRNLCVALLQPSGVGCEVSVDEGRLPVRVCERLALVVVELVMNAAKYAFVGRESGLIRVEMLRRDGAWTCRVADNGTGMEREHTGAGLKIVNVLVQSIGGRLAIDSKPSGTSVSIVLYDGSFAEG
jgi:two-component sensor histidine kinase